MTSLVMQSCIAFVCTYTLIKVYYPCLAFNSVLFHETATATAMTVY